MLSVRDLAEQLYNMAEQANDFHCEIQELQQETHDAEVHEAYQDMIERIEEMRERLATLATQLGKPSPHSLLFSKFTATK